MYYVYVWECICTVSESMWERAWVSVLLVWDTQRFIVAKLQMQQQNVASCCDGSEMTLRSSSSELETEWWVILYVVWAKMLWHGKAEHARPPWNPGKIRSAERQEIGGTAWSVRRLPAPAASAADSILVADSDVSLSADAVSSRCAYYTPARVGTHAVVLISVSLHEMALSE